jgi:hypothetical protein
MGPEQPLTSDTQFRKHSHTSTILLRTDHDNEIGKSCGHLLMSIHFAIIGYHPPSAQYVSYLSMPISVPALPSNKYLQYLNAPFIASLSNANYSNPA